MAKIIGIKKEPEEVKWWVNKQVVCEKCNSIIRLESEDRPFGLRQNGLFGPLYIVCPNPECKANVKVADKAPVFRM